MALKITRTAKGFTTVAYFGLDDNGKKIQKRISGKTKAEVQKQYDDLAKALSKTTVDVMNSTVGEIIDRYIELREKEASPATIRNYISYRRSSFQKLMDIKLCNLTDALCQKEIDDYAKDHQPKSVSLRWGLIHTAIKRYYPDFSPRVELPKIKRKRLEMPEQDQLFEFFKHLEGHKLEIPVLLSATCGLRRGEIAALDFNKDVDYEKCIIRISRSMVLNHYNQYEIKDSPKTEAANRAVPCPKWVIEKIAAAKDDPNYVMYKPNSITTGYHRHAPKFGLKCSFHGLRHYYVSVMESLGVPESYQMERVGHTTNYMLNKYKEYLNSKEVEVNTNLKNYMDQLNPYHTDTENEPKRYKVKRR